MPDPTGTTTFVQIPQTSEEQQNFKSYRQVGSDMVESKNNSSIDTRAKSPKATNATL